MINLIDNLGMETSELIMILIPLLLVQYGFAFYCIMGILKNGVANLNKTLWILICLFIGILGPILYLSFGRRKEV